MWRIAFSRVLLRPRLIFGLWLLSLLGAALAALPAGLALFASLADRPAVVKLARGQADALYGELFASDGVASPFAPMLLGSLLAGLLLVWLVQTLLSGGLVAALLRPGHPAHAAPGRLLARAGETAWAMLRIELLGLFALRLPLVVTVAFAGFLLGRRPELAEGSALALGLRFLPLVLVFFWLWSATSIVLHYARIARLTAVSRISTIGALRGGLHLAVHDARGRRATLGLGLLACVGYGLLITAGRFAAARLDAALLVGLAFVVRQCAALLRTLLGLGLIAGATEVWHALSARPSAQLPARTPSSEL